MAPLADPCWFELYKHIQDAGKGLILLNTEPGEAEILVKNISQRGLYISTAVEDEKEARELIHIAEMSNK